ncbi:MULTISPECIES: flagellar hook-basal body protein [Cytobacillus]|uniref:flagellar hook-basal body protein n=1 Tax=Cytobacillus TaxID=2675230 RepID=UPI00203CF614|nr:MULTISPECIES: flagellar hook-basal body protein [Cytobacillus]MBY0159294.1 flagellar hook-basal body protein [Cytobacillus firmus]MCM3391631.1 flagellar hook-basal body protein [Cytobacillus oceanisediminis]MCM3528955.1 flagellar hook-basal body protein [Cytobacillus oceanisediminis]UQX53666.1 flagellar hook-basal body protein [Cytobacillus pseudoceanisediminis]USK44130.1 flagellar hook-basal body protein [Cytobacillus oceanisediminis]
MFRGFYTAASGMLAQQRRTEVLTNNMANANTPGFKADQTSLRAFPEMLLQRIGQKTVPTEKGLNLPVNQEVGSLNSGVYMQETLPSFMQGDMKETGLNTDLALLDLNLPVNPDTGLSGSVFYTAAGIDGEQRYTRNGNFTLDGEGYLTTAGGLYILDDAGERIQLSSDRFKVSEDGVITGEAGETARLGIMYAQNPESLRKEGDGLFAVTEESVLENAYNAQNVQFKLQQGYLERSNVDASRTMTDMMTAYRSFEANQKVLQAYDRSMEKAANEIGRIG